MQRSRVGTFAAVLLAVILPGAQRAIAEPTQELQDQRMQLWKQAESFIAEENWTQATRVGEEFLAVERKMFGDEHEIVLSTLGWLAEQYATAANYDAALKTRRQAIQVAEKLHPTGHYTVVDARLSLQEAEAAAKLTPHQRYNLRNADALCLRAVALHKQGKYADGLPLARQAVTIRKNILGEQQRKHIDALALVAAITIQLEGHTQAESILWQVFELRAKVLGKEHPDTALALQDLGQVFAWTKQYEKAVALQGTAVEIMRKIYGDEHAEVATMKLALAAILRAQRDFEKALPLYQQVLATRKKVLGEDHPEAMQALDYLATTYQRMDDFRQAEPLFADALELRLKTLGVEHLETAETMNSLGIVNTELGNYQVAELLFEQSLATRRKLLDKSHADLAFSLNNLGSLYFTLGKYAAAEPLLLEAWQIKGQQGKDQAESLGTLNQLATLYLSTGNKQQAQEFAQLSLDISLKVNGEQHADTAHALDCLAGLYESQGDYAAAEPLCRRSYEILRSVDGNEANNTISALANLASLYYAMGDYSQAEPLQRQVLELTKKVRGEKHVKTANALTSLGVTYASLTDYKSAGKCYNQALDIYVATVGREHPDTAVLLSNYSLAAQYSGFPAQAAEFSRMALEIHRKVHGPDHQSTVCNLGQLGMLHLEMGEYDKAEPLLQEAADSLRRLLGDQHPLAASHLNKLAWLRQERGDTAKAELLARQGISALFEHLDRAFGGQSERQKLAALDDLRGTLDFWLSVAREANRPAEELYARVLTWKGIVFASEAGLRALRDDPKTADQFAEYQTVSRQLATVAMATPRNIDERAKRDARLTELTTKREAIEKQLAQIDHTFNEKRKEARLTPQQLQAILPHDVVLLDFFQYGCTHLRRAEQVDKTKASRYVTELQFMAFVVSKERGVAVVDLGPIKPIVAAIDRWRSCLGNWTGPAEEDPARELRRLLWEPVANHLGPATTVLISPDGALAQVPFAALPGDRAGEYLLHQYGFATIPVPQLLPTLLANDKRPHIEVKPSMLLVGGVDYGGRPGKGDDSGISRAGDRSASLADFQSLPGTLLEIKSVDEGFRRKHQVGQTHLLAGEKATESAFRDLASQHQWLHISTHGFFAPAKLNSAFSGTNLIVSDPTMFSRAGVAGIHPGLLSGLAMAGANQRPQPGEDDGILTALEVASLDLSKVDMAVLSACETGLGRVAGGEGVLGLQRAFQISGAKTVVASLWSVGDQATMRLMQRFYANLWDRNMSKLAALREAQLWLLSDPANHDLLAGKSASVGSTPSASLPPQYWAAFLVSGDWR